MKIAQVVCVFPPYPGGIGNVAYNFSKHLTDRGHELTVFTPDYGNDQVNYQEGFNVMRLKPFLKFGNSAFLPQLYKQLSQFEIVHFHVPFFGSLEVLYLLKILKPETKIILTYHMDFVPNTLFKKMTSLPSIFALQSLIKKIEAITVSSIDYIQNSQIKHLYNQCIDKFVEIPFGVDEVFLTSIIEPPETNEITNFLFVGGLDKAHYFKGLGVLIDAFKELPDHAKLTVIGDGELKKQYEAQTETLGLSSRVIFKGRVSDQELVEAYNQCHAFVMPSINQGEAFGLVYLNAFACKKPVIGSDLPGVRTVIDHEINGLLVKPNNIKDLKNKINYLVFNPKKAAKMGQNGYLKAMNQYQWPLIAQNLEKLYNQAL